MAGSGSGSGLQHEVMTILAKQRPSTLLDLLQPRICPAPPPGTQPSSAGKPPMHPVLQPIAVGTGVPAPAMLHSRASFPPKAAQPLIAERRQIG